jgi:apolipoprotein N-acyltransferase
METTYETKRPGWREWLLPLVAIAVWCMPAVAINIAHGAQAGSDAAIIFLSIMAVFFTALCALRLERHTAFPVRLLAGLLTVIGVTYNLSNAIGLVAGHSETMRSNALTQQGVRQSLQADLGQR